MPQPETASRRRADVLLSIAGAAVTFSWRRYTIAEHSMRPALDDGDWVLGTSRPGRLRIGDVIVCEHPDRPGFEITKRVTAIDTDQARIWVEGDDLTAGSIDSGTFGWIPLASVTCRLLLRYHPWPPRLIRA